jgi:hypothetical protein
VPWATYKVSVDSVEKLSGYDVLDLLDDQIEIAVESNTKPPVAATDGPYTSLEGAAVAMSAAGSSDPDVGQALTYAWNFGDGSTGTGVAPSHTYAQDGGYTIRLIVRDARNLADTITTTATVSNVAPTIAAFAGTTLLPGETYAATGSFVDPGADTWTATVDYGDGSGVSALGLVGKTFALSRVYANAGSFTVTVRVSDDDVTATRTATITVLTPAQAVTNASALVQALVATGKVNAGVANSLTTKLDGAAKALQGNNMNAAEGKLGALLNELEALTRSGRVADADVEALRSLIARVLKSISP